MTALVRLLATLAFASLFTATAFAQDYPNKPIRMIVPYAAGGLPDTITRIVAQRLSETMSQQVLVENRGGAGGIAGCEAVAKSPADGYTLLVADVGQVAINPFLYAKLSYDPVKDFVPISLMGKAPLFLVAHSSVQANTFAEFVALAKANPGKINYGSSGIGSLHHLSMEALKAALGLDIVHVPYKGTGQSVPALVGGQVAVTYSALPSLIAHIKSGNVKLLAVNTAKRSAQAPDVPAIAEMGVPGYDYPAEIGVLAPAGTPPAIVAKLSAEIAKAVQNPEVAKRLVALGIDPVGSTADAYAEAIRVDLEKYGTAVRVSGAKVE